MISCHIIITFFFKCVLESRLQSSQLEDTARYTDLLLAFKKNAVLAYFRTFWCSVVTSVTSSSKLSIFEKKIKNSNKKKLIQKNKNIKNPKKTQKSE